MRRWRPKPTCRSPRGRPGPDAPRMPSSTTGPPGLCWRPRGLEPAVRGRLPVEHGRRRHGRRCDLDRDDLVVLEHDGARIAFEELRALAVAEVDVDTHRLA